ncbi:hypothetical protein MMC30_004048 [Trapelia coarctata]|nr:hypothetical protein [Trapelia coarctata]
MFESPDKILRGAQERSPFPPADCMGVRGRGFSKQQLQPGEMLDVLQGRMMQVYTESLEWKRLSGTYVDKSSQYMRQISLLQLCRDVVVKAGAIVLYGERLLELEHDLLRIYTEFDEYSWMIFYKYPPRFAKKMSIPREKIVRAFTAYYQLPKDQRPGQAWYLRAMEDEQRALGISDRDIAVTSVTSFNFNVTSANPFKLCFWMLAYILFDSSLYIALRAEISSAFKAGTLDINALINNCPRLQAVFDEVLRLTTFSTSIRTVISPTIINGTHLRTGTKVLVPYRQLHIDPSVFGANVFEFQADRFLKDKSLGKSASYRPFGGGSTLCPGRFIARSQVTAFVAVVMERFDVELAPGQYGKEAGQRFPRMDEGKPSLGVMGPVPGDDFVVSVKSRH